MYENKVSCNVMKISELNKRFISYCVRNRLGRTNFGVRVIYFITNILGRFETYKNTQEFNKRGHYVPKLLLRRFRLAEKGSLKGKINQYSFLTNKITEENINEVAQIEDFYIFRQKGGGGSDYVEKVIYADFIETFGSQVIKHINLSDDDPDLTIFEQNVLATFVSHQITRTPAFYLQIRNYILFLYEKDLIKIDDLGSHESMRKIIAENLHKVTYEDMVSFVPKHSVRGDMNHVGHISRIISEYIMEDIFRHNFHFLYIPEDSGEEFVISDNPVVFLDFDRYEMKRYFDWWTKKSDSVWIFLPLSPKKCLYLTTQKRKDGPVEKEEVSELVSLVNFGQYLTSLCYVYGKNESKMQEQVKLYMGELLKYKTVVSDPNKEFRGGEV